MEFNKENIRKVHDIFFLKHGEIRRERPTDRANLSALWNKYLKGLGISTLENRKAKRHQALLSTYLLNELVDIVNYRNEVVAGAIIIPNPDRTEQFILVPRELAERALVIGLP